MFKKNHLLLDLQLLNIKSLSFFLLISLFTFSTVSATEKRMPVPKVSYSISFENPSNHYVTVEMEIQNAVRDFDVKMPVWSPGSYLVREFSKNIDYMTIENASIEKTAKNTWRISDVDYNKSSIKLTYKVYAYELSVRTSYLTDEYAYLNGTSMFMYIDNFKHLPSSLKIDMPKQWSKIANSLDIVGGNQYHRTAPNFDILVDAPILLGNQKEYEFEAKGVKHKIAVNGVANYDEETFANDIKKVAEATTDIFDKHPCKEYTFIVLNTPGSGGGLEHLFSTTVMWGRWNYKPERVYKRWLGLVAHEYFHLWNVKRIRPESLGPFNYDGENYTSLLWISEGFTSYYDDYILRRAGFYSDEEYLKVVKGNISSTINNAGDDVQSLSEASFDAWIKYYRKNENSGNTQVSYYTKGAVIGTLFDLMIMHESNGKYTLDDVMRDWNEKYEANNSFGLTKENVKATLEKYAGKNLDDFFAKYIDGTETVEPTTLFAEVGVMYSAEQKSKLKFGVSTKSEDGKLMITKITDDSPAYEAGLNVHDEIIAINGYRIDSKDMLNKILENSAKDFIWEITYSRDKIIGKTSVKLFESKYYNVEITKKEEMNKRQAKLYDLWMNR